MLGVPSCSLRTFVRPMYLRYSQASVMRCGEKESGSECAIALTACVPNTYTILQYIYSMWGVFDVRSVQRKTKKHSAHDTIALAVVVVVVVVASNIRRRWPSKLVSNARICSSIYNPHACRYEILLNQASKYVQTKRPTRTHIQYVIHIHLNIYICTENDGIQFVSSMFKTIQVFLGNLKNTLGHDHIIRFFKPKSIWWKIQESLRQMDGNYYFPLCSVYMWYLWSDWL